MIPVGIQYLLFIFYILFILLTPFVLLVLGLIRLKKRPENAKTLLIVSGVWLVVGFGYCGLVMNFT